MIRLTSRGVFRTALMLSILAGMVAATGGPAAAWQAVGSGHGLIGSYAMVDNSSSSANAGAVCHYVGSPTDHFRSMSIRNPVAWARDVTAHEDHQMVGWVAQLQKATSPSGPWSTVKTSPEEKRLPADETGAVFHPRTLSWQNTNPNLIYRSLVVIKWYRSGTVEGRVTLRIEFYRYNAQDASPNFVQQDHCQNVTD